MVNATRSMCARFGHIKRRLVREESLTGKHLELALNIVGDGGTGDKLIDGISNKLQTGQKLDPYELYLMVDVFLLHAKLGFASRVHQQSLRTEVAASIARRGNRQEK